MNKFHLTNPDRDKDKDEQINNLIKVTDLMSKVFEYCLKNKDTESASTIQMSATMINEVLDYFIKCQEEADKEYDEFINKFELIK